MKNRYTNVFFFLLLLSGLIIIFLILSGCCHSIDTIIYTQNINTDEHVFVNSNTRPVNNNNFRLLLLASNEYTSTVLNTETEEYPTQKTVQGKSFAVFK